MRRLSTQDSTHQEPAPVRVCTPEHPVLKDLSAQPCCKNVKYRSIRRAIWPNCFPTIQTCIGLKSCSRACASTWEANERDRSFLTPIFGCKMTKDQLWWDKAEVASHRPKPLPEAGYITTHLPGTAYELHNTRNLVLLLCSFTTCLSSCLRSSRLRREEANGSMQRNTFSEQFHTLSYISSSQCFHHMGPRRNAGLPHASRQGHRG